MPTPDEVDPFLHFVKPLNRMGYRFMVTGSVAAMLYGEPRMTNDVDLVLFLTPSASPGLAKLFPIEEFYCPPEEVIRIEAERSAEGHFNLIHHATGFKADIYLAGNDSLRHWGLGHATTFSFGGESIPVAPPEYVIVRKLEYFRAGGSQKHVRDIRAMLQISGDQIDLEILREKVAELGLQKIWDEVSEFGN